VYARVRLFGGLIYQLAIDYLRSGATLVVQESMNSKSRNMKLYVRRVFISDQFDEDLMPRYLSFMKGIIDSSDLPLNVSREILQENRIVRLIKKQLVKRTLDTLKQLSSDEDQSKYNTFFEAFGRNLKLVSTPGVQNSGVKRGFAKLSVENRSVAIDV
jgi:HSP90 family molecular chaperone